MTDMSARFALPLLQPGQAQKEVFHNEAINLLDIALHLGVMTSAIDIPPSAPVAGQAWIVGTSPGGEWANHSGKIAGWTGGGWRFVTPRPGMLLWVADMARWAWHDGITWQFGGLPAIGLTVNGKQVLGQRQAAIPDPVGGVSADPEARAALGSVLATSRAHGLIED